MSAYRYFNISNGLRGCYMPDSSCVARFKTRRELKEYFLNERNYAGETTQGLSKRAIAQFAAMCWKRKDSGFPYCLPTKQAYQTDYSYGYFVANATRYEYKEYLESENNY